MKTDPNIDQVLTDLRESQAVSQLPPEVNTAGVTVQKSLTAPMMLIDLYSPHSTYDSIFLANYAYINLVDELTRVPGIARVQVFGAGQYAMRVWVKPDQLAKLGVTVPQIVQRDTNAEHGESGGKSGRRACADRASNLPTRCERRAGWYPPKNSARSSSGRIPMVRHCD